MHSLPHLPPSLPLPCLHAAPDTHKLLHASQGTRYLSQHTQPGGRGEGEVKKEIFCASVELPSDADQSG
ncbi:hypothetical protein E2C01_060167 [Portunus trituberculatus]|uniref:Uncharacterized protein n=1 Tax=Portunus trituberculatus TaxID=210409 RepID=A0A5B7HBB0_PORTR|nr:hypothetical protein [Portunus trituberculatus]